ncbi:hypothetical protein LTR36_008041 [Oleoguttula mirabilis]|uniref:Alcohol dehydrogenase iron-type/glycerol dehydrogenase GldA domain-containing protein n=1 Tax=Oleoguttula mirabilis TaxID=1507867 RepID=A0AAV9JAL6_9PEZI|nr:hypothetical protein LTR36_008041 [Oleoguttula mirabilis]
MENRVIQQYDIPERAGHDAIFDASYLADIETYVSKWNSRRIVLVASKGLYSATDHVQRLEHQLADRLAAKKIGVGAHSPYKDVSEIAHLLQQHDADCLICIGSSSYSDACKIAAYLQATMPHNFSDEDMEALINQSKGAAVLEPAKAKLIVVPTSLSASEWNGTASGTNPAGKKQHFGLGKHAEGGPDLILMDPEVASTSPEELWLSSGVRCIDHCVETICNPECTPEASEDAAEGLAGMLKGLVEYREGKGKDRKEVLRGISACQRGSRQAIKGLVVHHNTFGPSHAIGHQLGSVAGVMHGLTTCVLLAPVLKYQKPDRAEAQAQVLRVFNETLGWQETDAADAMTRFVKKLGLPTTLSEVGVTDDAIVDRIAERTLTDVWGGGEPQITEKAEVRKILEMVR